MSGKYEIGEEYRRGKKYFVNKIDPPPPWFFSLVIGLFSCLRQLTWYNRGPQGVLAISKKVHSRQLCAPLLILYFPLYYAQFFKNFDLENSGARSTRTLVQEIYGDFLVPFVDDLGALYTRGNTVRTSRTI